MITLRPLYETPEHISLVADWIYTEFWTDTRTMTPEILREKLCDATTSSEIPMSWLAWCDDRPAGTVNLIECDSSIRPDLSPWLAALVVQPEFRKRGIGSMLVRECVEAARSLGVERLHLGTDIPAFYERLGWRIFQHVNESFCIMSIDLPPR